MQISDWLSTWTTSKLLAIAGLILASAFASSSETAFFSLNRFQLRRIKERYKEAYQRIRTLLSHPSRLLIMILLINEIVNISISTLVTDSLQHSKIFSNNLSHNQRWFITTLLSMLISLPILLIFGEITPKIIAAKMNRLVAMLNSKILMIIYKILFPLLWTLDGVIGYTLRKFKAEGKDHLTKTTAILSEEDIMLLTEQGHREGTVDRSERTLIENVFEFDDNSVGEVMTPIQQAFMVSAQARVLDVLGEIRLQKYSRIPVYQKSRKNIVGILYVKDLLAIQNHSELKNLEVRSLMNRPMFVSPTMRLSILFKRFKEAKTHMAIVGSQIYNPSQLPKEFQREAQQENAIGVVTMEDVLESIFGEITDERDEE